MRPTALITGASSGLGAEFARQLAARGADLVVVARDAEALERLAESLRTAHGVDVEVLPADLLDAARLAEVEARLADRMRPVEILVNNAGFGLPLAFETNDIDDEVRHLRLHVEAPMRLAHAALGPMLERGRGRVVNVASIAGFLPRSTYGAAKAWVVSFSRWAHARYAGRGVTVTAVCPGFVHTAFHERIGIAPGEEGVPGALWLEADDVVREALRDVARGRAVSIPSRRFRAIRRLAQLLPDSVVVAGASRGR